MSQIEDRGDGSPGSFPRKPRAGAEHRDRAPGAASVPLTLALSYETDRNFVPPRFQSQTMKQ